MSNLQIQKINNVPVSQLSAQMPRVFDITELRDGETGLIIQTTPPTLTKWDLYPFPEYNQAEFLRRVNLSFMPNLSFEPQPIYGDNTNRTALVYTRDAVTLYTGYYNGLDEYVEFRIDTNRPDRVPEGHTYPKNKYAPDGDNFEESKKVWSFEAYTTNTGLYTAILTDPNGGQWVAKYEDAWFLGMNSLFKIGEHQEIRLKRLWDITLEFCTHPKDENVITVQRITEGISRARLVTNYKDNPVDVLDATAIHKFPDGTKDFHTFFEKSGSGYYRCFGMEQNIPYGYVVGDNDFMVETINTARSYKCLDAIDVRSGRKFIKIMYAGKWRDWVETGGTESAQLVPKVIYTNGDATKGTPDKIELGELGNPTAKDTFMVSCGSRGMAIRVYNAQEVTNYSATYFVDELSGYFVYYMENEGSAKSSLEIFKYMPREIDPPIPWHPKLVLGDVIGDLSKTSPWGQRFEVELKATSLELLRTPKVEMRIHGLGYQTELVVTDIGKFYFNLPNIPRDWNAGDTVDYKLIWKDQLGVDYEGEEIVTKELLM